MKTQEQDFADINANASESDNMNYLPTNSETIEGTPFTIIEEKGMHFAVIGIHRITEYYENKEELKESLKQITWDRIVQVIWAVTKKFVTDYEQVKKIIENEN